ncbi:MAG: hypothetical protein Q7S84_00215 [bacterium]|nr:hypothetical protein [bacterium]
MSAEGATLDNVERELFTLERQRKATKNSRERAGIEAQLVALEQKREELRAVGVPSESPQSPEPQESQEPGGAKSAQAEQVPVMPLEEARAEFEHAAARYDSLSGSEGVFGKGRAEIALAAYLNAIDRGATELRAERKSKEADRLEQEEFMVLSRYEAEQFAAYRVFKHRSKGANKVPVAATSAGAPAPEWTAETAKTSEQGQNELQQATASLVDAAVVWEKTKENDSRRSERATRVNEALAKYLTLLTERIDADVAMKRQELAGKDIAGAAAGKSLKEFYEDKIERGFIHKNNEMLKNLGITGVKKFPALKSFLTHVLDVERSLDKSL